MYIIITTLVLAKVKIFTLCILRLSWTSFRRARLINIKCYTLKNIWLIKLHFWVMLANNRSYLIIHAWIYEITNRIIHDYPKP